METHGDTVAQKRVAVCMNYLQTASVYEFKAKTLFAAGTVTKTFKPSSQASLYNVRLRSIYHEEKRRNIN